MKIGFIGYGKLGSVLIKSLLKYKALEPNDIIVSTRTKEKVKPLINEYADVVILDSNPDVASRCKFVFICASANDAIKVIEEIKNQLSVGTHLVITSAGLEISSVEKIFDGKITKIMPTVIQEAGNGVTLVCHNRHVDDTGKEYIEGLFSKVGIVKVIDENQFEAGTVLTSCAPAFFAKVIKEFANAGINNSTFSKYDATNMVIETLLGTAKLLYENKIELDDFINEVSTEGGVTEQGIKILQAELPGTFENLFTATLRKQEEIKGSICQKLLAK